MEGWRGKNSDYWDTHDAYEEVESKRCMRCKTPKPSREFYKSRTDKYGLQAWCIVCIHKRHVDNPKRQMLVNARARARRSGLEFSLSETDIIIPEICPVLGIPLEIGRTQNRENSPSLDRVDNAKGYVPGNVCVISYRANSIKRDSTVDEVERVLRYMKNEATVGERHPQ